ncbi:DUF72 domain-containing protein [Pedobacter sp. PWIIR3]
MDFGKVADHEIKNVDFTLPPDGSQTAITLANREKVVNPEIRVGCGRFGRKEWVGKLFPTGTQQTDFLTEYARHFDSLEFNSAFYSMPSKYFIQKWRRNLEESGNTNFLVLPKVSRDISHISRLSDDKLMPIFLESIREFGTMLGPIFFQLGDNFGSEGFDDLENFVTLLPNGYTFYTELRNKEWFCDQELRARVLKMLTDHSVGLVITDSSGRRDLVHMELTTPELFVRFVGNGRVARASDFARVDAWIDRIKVWLNLGLEKVYFMVHQHDEYDTPVLANYVIKEMNARIGTNIPEIIWRDSEFELNDSIELGHA